MGAGGGKTSTSKSSSPYAPLLAQFGSAALQPFQQYSAQAGEALRTGGVNAQIPIIARSADAARSALSGSTEQTRQALARSGLGNSSFGQQILADIGQQGAENIASIGPNAAQQFIGNVPNIAGQSIGASSAAASTTRSASSTPSFWDMFTQGLQSVAGLGTDAALAFA